MNEDGRVYRKVLFTDPLWEILRTIQELEDRAAVEAMVEEDPRLGRLLISAAHQMRMMVRDTVYAGHRTEAEYDRALAQSQSRPEPDWVDSGGLTSL